MTLTQRLSITIGLEGLLVFFLFLFVILFTLGQSESAMDEELKNRGDALVHKLIILSRDLIKHDDKDGLFRLVNNMAKVEDDKTQMVIMYAMIYDNSGNLIAQSDISRIKSINPLEINKIDPAKIPNKGALIADIRSGDWDFYDMSSLISSDNQRVGIARIGVTKGFYKEETKSLKIKVLIFSAIIGSLCLLIGYHLIRRITSPLNQLIKSVEVLDYENPEKIKISNLKRDEIDLLTYSFNRIIQMWREGREKLKESEEMHVSLWEHAEDPMLRIDINKMIIAANRRVEDVLGYSKEVILGSTILDMIPDDYHNLFDNIFQYTLKEGKAETTEIEVLKANKGLLSMELDMRRVLNEKTATFAQIHFRDVSKRNEIEQELISSARFATVGELTAKLAHEVNNPLGVILGFSQEILSEIDNNDPHYRSVRIITEEAKRCKNVMKHLLAFARPPSLKYSSVEIEEIIRESLELILGILEKRGILIKKIVPAALPRLYVDPSQIKAVLLNLYNNAIDAMPQGGELTISVSLNGPDIKITVLDTGGGIKDLDLNNIFMPYFTTKEGGTGLGLCISKRIIEGHKGRLELETKPGIGTSFTISLPAEVKSGETNSDKGQGVQ